ncbi:hypothetical protein JI435_117030, partial [Parastagonospora nodorum SN15]
APNHRPHCEPAECVMAPTDLDIATLTVIHGKPSRTVLMNRPRPHRPATFPPVSWNRQAVSALTAPESGGPPVICARINVQSASTPGRLLAQHCSTSDFFQRPESHYVRHMLLTAAMLFQATPSDQAILHGKQVDWCGLTLPMLL